MSHHNRAYRRYRDARPPAGFSNSQVRPVHAGGRELLVRPLDDEQLQQLEPNEFGLNPAPAFEDEIAEPFDLGEINEKYKGHVVIYNKTLDLSIQDVLEKMRDPKIPEIVRSRAAKEYLRKTLVGWNFTRIRKIAGKTIVEKLLQPPEGIEQLPVSLDLLVAIIQGYNQVMSPSPN